MGNIFVFGDSIGAGAWDNQGGWPARLQIKIANNYKLKSEKFWPSVLNLSISGDMVAELTSRILDEYSRRCYTIPDNTVIIAKGVNDARAEGTKNNYVIGVDQFKSELFKLSQKLRNTTKQVVILGLSPVIDTKLNPCAWDDLVFWQNARVKEFNDILKAWAEAKGYVFIDLHAKTEDNQKYIDSLDDGIHPGPEGHEIIAEEVFNALEELKFI